MKVIVKSNEYIAIPTNKMADCLFELGQNLNMETCKIEMDHDELRSIICTKHRSNSSYSTNIKLEANNFCGDKYIILDTEGNLVNVVDKEQFVQQYAILQDDKED